jgi:hypothetical protein
MTTVIPGQPVRAEPQLRNCAAGNLDMRVAGVIAKQMAATG